MNIGWMWFDDDPKRTLEEKVKRATRAYRDKFGHAPNRCFVNKGQLDGQKINLNGLKVVGARNVLRHHFWLGVEKEQKEPAQVARQVANLPPEFD